MTVLFLSVILGYAQHVRARSHNLTFLRTGSASMGHDVGHLLAEANITHGIIEFNQIVSSMNHAHASLLNTNASRKIKAACNSTFTGLYLSMDDVRDELEVVCAHTDCGLTLRPFALQEKGYRVDALKRRIEHGQNEVLRSESEYTFQYKDRPDNRTKRQLGPFVGLASFGLSIYDALNVHHLHHQLSDVELRMKHIMATVETQSVSINQNVDNIRLLEAFLQTLWTWKYDHEFMEWLEILSMQFRDYTSILHTWAASLATTLTTGKLAPRFFDASSISHALSHLQMQAAGKDLVPMASTLHEVLGHDISFFVRNGVIHLIVHIPLRKAQVLELYQYIPSPMLLSDGRAVLANTQDLLAINREMTEYAQLSLEQLHSCKRIKNTFLCSAAITHTDLDTNCLAALYTGRTNLVQKLCIFIEVDVSKVVITQLSTNKVSIYSPESAPATVILNCRGVDATSRQLRKGQHEITVPENCILVTGDSMFRPTRTHDFQSAFHIRTLAHFEEGNLETMPTHHELGRLAHEPDIPMMSALPVKAQKNFVAAMALLAFLAVVGILGVFTFIKVKNYRDLLTKRKCARKGHIRDLLRRRETEEEDSSA